MLKILRFIRKAHMPLLTVSLVALFWTFGSGAFEFMLPTFLDGLLKGNAFLVGVLLALPGFVAVISDIPIGEICDKVSRKTIIAWALTGIAATALLMLGLNNFWWLVPVFLLWGFFYQLIAVPMYSYLVEISPKRMSAEYAGVYTTFVALGFSVGPLIGGLLLSTFTETSVFYFYATICILVSVGVMLSLKRIRKCQKPVSEGIIEVIKEDKLFIEGLTAFRKLGSTGRTLLLFSCIIALWDSIVWVSEPLYYSVMHFDPSFGGLLLMVFVVPYVIFSSIGGIIADRCGKKKTATLGLIIAIISSLCFVLDKGAGIKLISAFLISTGLAVVWSSVSGMLISRCPRRMSGEISGVWSTASDVGYTIGPIVAGALFSIHPLLPFCFGTFMFVVLLIVLAFVEGE
ncbi:MAG: MFS transporter [Candidatus Diapherotrites archaeon]|nr:MFS transporter [Candidatus Diapherotrites archaeon]